jgi:protein gp37
MADKTRIEWTDATWNPVTGCTKVSPGCKHCYAERTWARLSARATIDPELSRNRYTGRPFTDVRCHPDLLAVPWNWSVPRRIFVNSMSDLFHPDVPFEFIAAVFWIMSVTTRHTYQVLTKRPDRMLAFFDWALDDPYAIFQDEKIGEVADEIPEIRALGWTPWREGERHGGYDNCGPGWPFANVWLGVSIEDQATADERIPQLLRAPAAVRWISAEPLLGPVDLRPYLDWSFGEGDMSRPDLDWVVVGGESGPKARPSHPGWVRSLRDQCAATSTPFLFKQWGEWAPLEGSGAEAPTPIVFWREDQWRPGFTSERTAHMVRIGKKTAGRVLDGELHDEYPGDPRG